MSCLVPRSVDIDSAELIVRCVFNRLVIVVSCKRHDPSILIQLLILYHQLRAPYLDAIRTLDQRVMLADRQNPTPLLHGLMDRTTPRLCTLKETHHEAIIAYQTYIIAYTRSIRASERKYQGTLIMYQKSQHNAAQSIGALYQKLSAELEAHQRSIITTNDLIAGVKRVGQTDFAADPTDAARLEALRKYQDQLLFHQATMITNALNITAFEEKTRSMIAARQVHVLKTAREIAALEARHEAAFTGHKAEIKEQGAALMRLVYCQHAELERARVKLMDIVEIGCPIVVAVEGGGNPGMVSLPLH